MAYGRLETKMPNQQAQNVFAKFFCTWPRKPNDVDTLAKQFREQLSLSKKESLAHTFNKLTLQSAKKN